MKSITIRTLAAISLISFYAQSVFADTINVATGQTVGQQDLANWDSVINVASGGLVATIGIDSAVLFTAITGATANISGGVTSSNASAIDSYESNNTKITLDGSGFMSNESDTANTVFINTNLNNLIELKTATTSITNNSQASGAYAVGIYNSTSTVNNAGKISGGGGILLTGSSTNATINNSGTIESTDPTNPNNYAIKIESNATGQINNSGTITGNIDLGTSSSSSITLQSGGSNTGKVTFGNSAQVFNINQGSTFNGSIAGTLSEANLAGALNFTEDGSFTGNIIGSGTGNLNLGATTQVIDGSLTLSDGDTLKVAFESDGSFGNLRTTQAANVSENSKIAISLTSQYSYLTDGSSYKILQGGAGSDIATISASNIDVNNSGSNGFSVLRFTTQSYDQSLFLLVTHAKASYVSSDINAQSVYNNINQIGSAATGQLALFQNYIQNSSSQNDVEKALKSATTQSDDGIRQTSLNVMNNSFRNIENRLDQIRVNSFFAEPKDDDLSILKEAPTEKQGIKAWAQTFGASAKQNQLSNNGGEGYKSSSNGFIFGFDKAISKKTNLGLALTYANSNIKSLDSLKKTGVDTYQLNVYSGYNSNGYFLDSIAAFAFNNYNSSRNINSVNTRASGKFNGETYSAKIRGGFFHELGSNFTLAPESSLTFSNNRTANYRETGAGTMNLNVESSQTNFLEGRAGLNLLYKTIRKNGLAISPQIKVSYGYDLLGDRQNITNSFEGQSSSFNTKTAKYDGSSLRLGFAIDLYRIDSLSLSSEYSFEDKTKYQSHSAFLRGGYSF